MTTRLAIIGHLANCKKYGTEMDRDGDDAMATLNAFIEMARDVRDESSVRDVLVAALRDAQAALFDREVADRKGYTQRAKDSVVAAIKLAETQP